MSRDRDCPKCGAEAGTACRDTRTGEPMRTQHWDRLVKPYGQIQAGANGSSGPSTDGGTTP